MTRNKKHRAIEDVNRTIRLLIDAAGSAYTCATNLAESQTKDPLLVRMRIQQFEQSKTILLRAQAIAATAGQLRLWRDLLDDDMKDLNKAIARLKKS